MTRLLHSKTFRKNLFNWIFVYLFVIVLFACVVTYSRYISSMSKSDGARTASFKVEIDKGKLCSTASPNLCELDSYKPYDIIEYDFSVNTEKVEVSTLLAITIDVDKDFKIDNLVDAENNRKVSFPTGAVDDELEPTLDDGMKIDYESNKLTNKLIISGDVGPRKNNVKTYKLRIKLKSSDYTKEYTDKEIVKVSWAATQKD